MLKRLNEQLFMQSRSIIAGMICSKMPGGFNITSARDYLTVCYSLRSGRYYIPFMQTMAMEPISRLKSQDDEKV